MEWKAEYSRLVERMAALLGVPEGDDQGRVWTQKVAEQFNFSFPGEGWGCKRASATRPLSSDCLARRTATAFVGYDLLRGVNSPNESTRLILQPSEIDLLSQVFVPVAAQNHLNDPVSEQPGGSGVVSPTPAGTNDLADSVRTLTAEVRTLAAALDGVTRINAALEQKIQELAAAAESRHAELLRHLAAPL